MPGQLFSDNDWEKLSTLLHIRVAHWVFNSHVPLWTRQRDEIIEDIVQNALLKTFIYTQRAERGEVARVDSLEKVGAVTAYHCYIDALRHDQRLLPLLQDAEDPFEYANTQIGFDPSEQIIDNIHYGLIFVQAARCIVKFPNKQRAAILTYLANSMDFDPFNPTALQKAFASVGIRLEEYQKPLPLDKGERAKYAALLSYARKRLREQCCIDDDELFA